MRKLKVLLVEDNDFTRSTVAAGLRAEQCEVVGSVATAKEAVSLSGELDFDCAVIDLHLGAGPSGIDLAHSLRRRDPDLLGSACAGFSSDGRARLRPCRAISPT